MEFVDAHTHMELLSLRPLEGISSLGELLSLLEDSGEEVFLGWGWSEDRLGVRLEKKHLDSVKKPVLLLRTDAHLGVLNDALVEKLGLTPGDKFDPLRGYLYEEKLWEVVSLLKPKGEKMRRVLEEGLFKAKSMGVKEVHDFVDSELAGIYLGMEELPISVVLMPYYEDYREVLDMVRSGNKLKIGWVKVFVDGSIGARTAYLSEPYADRKNWRGVLLKRKEELAEIIDELETEGLRVAFHAIGDGAIEECLSAFEEVKPKLPYHRIEHAELITYGQALRVKEMNLLLCVQPNFTPFFKNTYLEALGKGRAERVNPIKMLDELGVNMIFGSDMMPFDPLYGFDYAKSILGEKKAKYYYGGWKIEGKYI